MAKLPVLGHGHSHPTVPQQHAGRLLPLLLSQLPSLIPVSPGGEDSTEAAPGVCGVHRAQCLAAHPRRQCRGSGERWVQLQPPAKSLLEDSVPSQPACHLFVPLFPGACPWSNLMAILGQRSGADTELLVFTMTLINKVCGGVPVVPHWWGSV